MKLVTIFEKPELDKLSPGVVVERWKHIGYGRAKRAFQSEFTLEERVKVRRIYNVFYKWYLQTGTPAHHTMKTNTYEFMKRVCNFFAGL